MTAGEDAGTSAGRTLVDLGLETVVELFHRFQLDGWLAVQPDLQWIRRPAGDPAAGDHWMASVRVELAS